MVGTEDKEKFREQFLTDAVRKEFKLIGTHSETFHCDEVMATSMLLRTKEFKNSIIVRTRDQAILDELDIQCDVGGEFDPAKKRFDHHQRTFKHHWFTEENEKRSADRQAALDRGEKIDEELYKPKEHVTVLSSAGLIYKFFGKEVIQQICQSEYEQTLDEETLEYVYQKIYKGLILEIDSVDNGVQIAEDPKYYFNTDLSRRVQHLNSPWNAPKEMSQHVQFKKAMKLCEEEFLRKVYSIVTQTLPAKNMVKTYFNERHAFHSSKEFVHIRQYCPWHEHLTNQEKEEGVGEQIKFVFYQDQRGMFRVQAVNKTGFINRVSLHEKFRGLREKELQEISGCNDAVFVHAAGFIGGAWSLESCVKMAEVSMDKHREEEEIKAKGLEKKQKTE